MSASKALAIGIAAFALGASGSPGASATQSQTRQIAATATADAVTFVNNSPDGRFLIIKMSGQAGEAPPVSSMVGEARIPATSADAFLIYRVSAGYTYVNGVFTDCTAGDCPIPPPCPPPAKCPWARHLSVMKAKTP